MQSRPLSSTEVIPARFPTTRWTQVRRAGEPSHPHHERGWEWLAAHYWYPLYTFARRTGRDREQAADLTQSFFPWLLESDLPAVAAPERGRFRSLLLTAFKHHLGREARRERSLKRGGVESPVPLDAAFAEHRYCAEPSDLASPDKLYERRWALDLIQRALDRLEAEVSVRGRPALFAQLKATLLDDGSEATHAELAARLGMSEGAVKAAVHRLRQRFRALVRDEVAATVQRAEDVDDELRHIQAILSGGC